VEFSIDDAKQLIEQYLIPFGINLTFAALILIVGRWIAGALVRVAERLMRRAKVEESLVKFITDLAYALMLTCIVIASLERVGVQTTAAIAVLGAMGLAVGLALQGSLGNFAAGVMIILFKPYKVGDLVKLDGYIGHIHAVQVFNTILITLDHKKIIIPNGNITGTTIENISALGTVRVDMVFGISYSDDIDKAKAIFQSILANHELVLKDPAPSVNVLELGDSSVNFAVRPFVDPAHYWDVWFDVTEAVKKQLDAADVTIPFPQRDVHLYKQNAA